jgi:hypothetical protein
MSKARAERARTWGAIIGKMNGENLLTLEEARQKAADIRAKSEGSLLPQLPAREWKGNGEVSGRAPSAAR